MVLLDCLSIDCLYTAYLVRVSVCLFFFFIILEAFKTRLNKWESWLFWNDCYTPVSFENEKIVKRCKIKKINVQLSLFPEWRDKIAKRSLCHRNSRKFEPCLALSYVARRNAIGLLYCVGSKRLKWKTLFREVCNVGELLLVVWRSAYKTWMASMGLINMPELSPLNAWMDGVATGAREDDIEMAPSSLFYFSWTRTANCSCVVKSVRVFVEW